MNVEKRTLFVRDVGSCGAAALFRIFIAFTVLVLLDDGIVARSFRKRRETGSKSSANGG